MGGINKRQHLLHAGQKVLWNKGYDRSSVHDITSEASLPKGSFYHYFESKEKFALEAMNDFIENFQEKLPSSQISIETFGEMIDARIEAIVKINYAKECYMSVMCHSYSDQNESFRLEILKAVKNSNIAMFELLLSLKNQSLLNNKIDIHELMEFIDFAWRGARLKARLSKSKEPLLVFKKFLTEYILKK
jgi:TetR/AcrR family transcriptional regulator, transcriptional repressor for nem operon